MEIANRIISSNQIEFQQYFQVLAFKYQVMKFLVITEDCDKALGINDKISTLYY